VGQTAGLSITKAGPATVEPGAEFDYTLVVSNAAGQPAATVTVTDELPEGVDFVESDPAGCIGADTDTDGRTEVTCTVNDLAGGGGATITLTVRAPTTAGEITNRASADNSADTAPTVNSNEVTTRVVPDLEINRLDDPDPVSDPEDLLLYTLRVQNRGNNPVSGVAVTDDLPLSQVDFITVESSDFVCQYNAGAVQCNLREALGPGEIATVEIVVEPEVAGTIRNRADVFIEGLDDPVDTDVEETLVEEAAASDDDYDDDGNDDDGNGDDRDRDRRGTDIDEEIIDEEEVDVLDEKGGEVLADTIPDGSLPNTGGISAAAVLAGLGFTLLLAGLSAGYAVARRRS
jgi:uncharacterized repeat protein (TIGR01451 family)/LPXTG-motif cell wall-anchored protein